MTEICDQLDNDCDGGVDEDWPDPDGDGVGNCVPNDSDGDTVPDELDNCPATQNTAQADLDVDGLGDACDLDRDGDGVANGSDCDPDDAGIHPLAFEKCNGVDDDCDGQADEINALGCVALYVDKDEDGFGVGTPDACLCLAGGSTEGFSSTPGDCADWDASVYPGAPEVCDGKDNDCDGGSDNPGSPGCVAFYFDGDGDGFYTANATSVCLCGFNGEPPFTGVEPGDCDDSMAHRHPGATESCDGVDDDCNGTPDNGCDLDGDGYCNAALGYTEAAKATACAEGGGDCDDGDPAVHPGAVEQCDGKDNNCVPDSDLLEGTVDACGPTCSPCEPSTEGEQVLCTGVGPGEGCMVGCPSGFFCADCVCDGTQELFLGSTATESRLVNDSFADGFRLALFKSGSFRMRGISKNGVVGPDLLAVPGVQKWTTWGVAHNESAGGFLFGWTTYPDSSIRIGLTNPAGSAINQQVVVPDTLVGTAARRHVNAAYHAQSDTYLVLWDEDAALDRNVRGVVLASDGSVSLGAFDVVGGSGDQERPQVALRPNGAGYLVGYMHKTDTGANATVALLNSDGVAEGAFTLAPAAQSLAGLSLWYEPSLDRGVVQWLATTGKYQVAVIHQNGMMGPAITTVGGTLGAVAAAPESDVLRLAYVYGGTVRMRNLVASSADLLPGSATINTTPGVIKLVGGMRHTNDDHALMLWNSVSGLRGRLISP